MTSDLVPLCPRPVKFATSIIKWKLSVKVLFQFLICSALARPNVCVIFQQNDIVLQFRDKKQMGQWNAVDSG